MMSLSLSIFTACGFLMVIAALLRQLIREREERFALMQHYANLALRVRWVQATEENPMAEQVRYPEQWANQSSVHDVEGVS